MKVLLQKAGDGLFSAGQPGSWTAAEPYDFQSTAAAIDFATRQRDVLLRDLQLVIRYSAEGISDTIIALGTQP